MRPFRYLSPGAIEEASQLLDRHGHEAMVIAGGQTLLLELKARTARPAYLVSLAGIDGLSGVRIGPAGELIVGATTTYAALCRAELQGWHSEVAAIAGNLADRPVRTMGTIGGALCAADPRFDMPTLAVGTNAQLDLVGSDGPRTVAAEEFFAVGDNGLRHAEILTAVRFPAVDVYSSVIFRKFRQRTFDAAVTSVLLAARRVDGALTDVRIAVGAVGPAPALARRTAAGLTGVPVEDIDVAALSESVVREVLDDSGDQPLVQYQRELIRSLTRETFTDALTNARS